jgi:hypothetical protein
MAHSKNKGNIGFSSAVLELQLQDFNVFSEIGDLSKVDIIAEKNGILKKIQVKYSAIKNGKIKANLIKSGPNGYSYTYKDTDVDWFAVYCPDNKTVYWISMQEMKHIVSLLSIRILPTKNNQKCNVNLASNYDISKFLKEFD